MNRIYQGRVTRVEILNGKKAEPQPLPDWPEKLWRHHELFQDAVNYYTLALAAMACGLRPTDSGARESEIQRLNAELESIRDEAKAAKKAKDETRKEELAKKEQQVEETIDRLQREDAVWLWREQVRKAWEEGVERGAQRFKWNRETPARMLKKLDPDFDAQKASFDACCDGVLRLSKGSTQQRASALLYLLELAGGKTDLAPLVESKLPWLSNPSSGDLTDDATKSRQRQAAHVAVKRLENPNSNDFASLAKELQAELLVTKCKRANGEDARQGLLDAFKLAVAYQADAKKGKPFTEPAHLAPHIKAYEDYVKALPDDFSITLAAGKHQREYRFAAVLRAAYAKHDEKEEVGRDLLLLRAAATKAFQIASKGLADKEVKVVETDWLKEGRTAADTRYFDYFTNLAFTSASNVAESAQLPHDPGEAESESEDDDSEAEEEGNGTNRAVWFEWDKSAFVEALKSPHRYFQDTIKRKKECARLEQRVNKMHGVGEFGSEQGDDDTTDRIEGFAGDHRIGLDTTIPGKKGIKQLIHDKELLAYREDDDADDESEYGINENTLRGWGELRRKWREAADKEEFKGEANKEALMKELNRIRRDEQGDRPEEAGSGPLFKRLAEVSEYHCIWKDPPPNPDVHADDPLWAWVHYRELHDEWQRLKNEPIRFTPAHATESPRFFTFPKQNRPKTKAPSRGNAAVGRKSDHLPGMFAYDDAGEFVPVHGNEPWLRDRPRFMAFNTGLVVNNEGNLQPTSVRIYFSAPRLRRDRIRSDTEQSLGDVSLLQPMLEALGVSPKVPNINFANCSVRLSAERRERPNERAADESEKEQKQSDRYDLHLEFPVTLNVDELKNHELFQHGQRWVAKFYTNKKTKERIARHAQFNFSGDDDLREISLRWPTDRKHFPRKSDPALPWYESMGQFSCLPLDLGQREGGAYAVLDARANANFGTNKAGKSIPSRFIGRTGEKKWRVALAASGLLKLPGEDARVFRPKTLPSEGKPSPDDRNPEDAIPGKKFREELWGESGRTALRSTDPDALIDETKQAQELLGNKDFDQLDIMPPGWDDPGSPMFLSFPEQNDRLIVAARRYLSRVRRLHRWCAFLNPDNWPGKPDKAKQKHERALQEIREACGLDDKGVVKLDDKTSAPLEGEAWLAPSVKRFVQSGADDSGLAEELKALLEPMLAKLPSRFETLANRCAPLRGRSWRWTERKPTANKKIKATGPLHILVPTGDPIPNAKMLMPDGKEQKVTWIRGQRGLSMKRIGQLEDLRRLLQSLNQIQRRQIRAMPPRRKRGERGEELPDCCPKLLEKLDNLKEQRVNQLAHQVLALALGLRLKKSGPTKGDAEREHSDIHGEYERIPDSSQPDGFRRPVDFIVLEDLKYYETTRVRSRRENVRLMRWCRRHFRDKLRQLCDVFGIPVVEANPANTSKFCARTGVAGFRAVEVGPGFHEAFVWRKALEKLDLHRTNKKKLEPDDLAFCEGTEKLKKQVKDAQTIPTKSGKPLPCPRTLLAPLGSGNVFVPVVGEVNGADLPPAVVQADVNAAAMLGLRAIADPQLWEIHPRLRTKPPERTKKSKRGKKGEPEAPRQNPDEKVFPPELFAAEKRKFGDKTIKLDLANASEDGAIKDSRKPNFFRDLAGVAHWDKAVIPDPKTDKPVSLPSGKAFWGAVKAAQWKRCLAINEERLKAWRNKLC